MPPILRSDGGCGHSLDPMPVRRTLARALAIVCIVMPAACSTDRAADDAAPTRPDSDGAFGWRSAGDGLQVGHLDVPIDRAHPENGTFTLLVERHLAERPSERIGSLLVNPGGPGFGGTGLAEAAASVYGRDVLDHFDIVGWDPRGTGRSVPRIDCVDDYDPYFSLDSSPDTPAEQHAVVDAATRFGAACVRRSGAILPFVSTAESARDMDAIRRALGEDSISYFGFSYGSELGVTWATMFPHTVRAMVIDGAADGTVGAVDQNLQQAAGFEAAFDAFLQDCADHTDCAFHENGAPAAAFDALNAAVDAAPVPTEAGRPGVTQGVLATAVADALYSRSSWLRLASALAALQSGEGAEILALYDDYYERSSDGSFGDELEAYFAIGCLDDPGITDPTALFARQDDFTSAAPRLGASWMLELQVCASWPVPASPVARTDAAGAGPIVVVGTTGDPATPLAGTRRQAEALVDGRLVVVTADQHTGYGLNDCVNDAVDHYLVAITVPKDELVCDR